MELKLDEELKNILPKISIFDKIIHDDEGETKLFLLILEYKNALQVALYDKKPKLGSMSMGYTMVEEQTERYSIFSGKHAHLSDALALILSKKTDKIVYASANVSEQALVTLDMVKELISEYLV